MADYKRFVSYMYEYDNGVKKKNVGYARVETRNSECKFTIHMQLEGLAEGIFPTYLIHRPTDDMDLVYLGDCVVKNQLMDSRLSANENNIMDSGHRFSDMGGILLFLNSGVFYATQWDDKPVVLEEVLGALKPKPKTKRPEEDSVDLSNQQEAVATLKINKQKETENESSSPSNSFREATGPIYMLPGGWKMTEGAKSTNTNKPVNPWEMVEKYKKATENQSASENLLKDVMPVDIKEKENSSANPVQKDVVQKDVIQKDVVQKDVIQKDIVQKDVIQKDVVQRDVAQKLRDIVQRDSLSKEIKSIDSDKEDRPVDIPVGNIRQEEKNKDTRNINNLGNEQRRDRGENPLAANILANYPRIYPFEDNEITRCVKIEPKDIGKLPSDTWILSNNSFLLHGFYCYHHLIFAEILDRYGYRYIIGIPGIYHNRERFMARMFGFECFKSIRKRELKQGDFGYWCLDVNF